MRRRAQKYDGPESELLGELSRLHGALEEAYMRFDATVEPELVEACVYEINAAQARYNHLFRVVKDLSGAAAFGAYAEKGADT